MTAPVAITVPEPNPARTDGSPPAPGSTVAIEVAALIAPASAPPNAPPSACGAIVARAVTSIELAPDPPPAPMTLAPSTARVEPLAVACCTETPIDVPSAAAIARVVASGAA